MHTNYANDDGNFRQIDQLLQELPSMQEVLTSASRTRLADKTPSPATSIAVPTSSNQTVLTTPISVAAAPEYDFLYDLECFCCLFAVTSFIFLCISN